MLKGRGFSLIFIFITIFPFFLYINFVQRDRTEIETSRKTIDSDDHLMLVDIQEAQDLHLKELTTRNSTAYFKTLLMKRFPSCIILGFPKCGTHALRTFISVHPDVVVAPREAQYFSKYYDMGNEWYRQQMPLSLPHQITIEKTPKYVQSRDALNRIHHFNSSMKLIVIMTDPVLHTQSHYARDMVQMPERRSLSLNEWFKTIGGAEQDSYFSHLEYLYQLFPANQVLPLNGDDLIHKPVQVIQEVERFLGLKPHINDSFFYFNTTKGFFCMDPKVIVNPRAYLLQENGCFRDNKGREHTEISAELRNEMAKFYPSHNQKLFHLIKRSFNWSFTNLDE